MDFYEPANPKKGLCVGCMNKLYRKGKNQSNCEYRFYF